MDIDFHGLEKTHILVVHLFSECTSVSSLEVVETAMGQLHTAFS